VAEDDRFYAFLDINPLAAGHTLVVPKFSGAGGGEGDDSSACDRASASSIPDRAEVSSTCDSASASRATTVSGEGRELDYIFDLDDDTLGAMMVFAKRVAARIREATGAARVAVMVLGLEVPHVHIHLIPIDSEADVDLHKPRVKMSPEEFAALAAKLAE
jgi:histidine triad (HIT) family protein